jgi:Glycosyltransferase family 87
LSGLGVGSDNGGRSKAHRTDVPPDRRFKPSDGAVAAINHALLVFPALVTLWLFAEYYSAHQIAVDFHHDFWIAGSRVMHGVSPYDWSRRQIAELASFPYPAPAALLFVPFSLLPRGSADLLFLSLTVAACLGSLRILRVRDWRLYALVFLFWPVINAWQTANVTLLLVCGIAAIWRYRESPLIAGAVFGVMVCVKPIVWPIALWLLFTRRIRATAWGLASALVLNLIAWALIGFGQVDSWLHLLSLQTDVLYRHGYGLIALATRLGAGRGLGTMLQLFASVALAGACVRFARAKRDREAFTLAVDLMIVSSPLVDNHYFALLIVPLAIAQPYLSRLWALPLLLWLCPATGMATWQILVAWATTTGATYLLLAHPRPALGASNRGGCVVTHSGAAVLSRNS